NVHFAQALDMLYDVARARSIHHPAPQFGIGGMHRDIERRQLLLVESLPVLLLQVRQGDKVAEEERVAIVIILDIQRSAHTMRQPWLRCEALGQSLDKAEDTFIGALADKRSGLFTKEHAQVLIIRLRDIYFLCVLLSLKTNRQFFLCD